MCIRKRRRQMKRRESDRQQETKSAAQKKRPRPAPIAFGPYLADRQWATIREDLSADGSCWESCDFRRSHRDPYLAGEDGLLGVCDERGRLCFAWGFWNGLDPFVKEKLFGLTGGCRPQGNHGEDVKEAYFYQLSTPDHDYMRATYMYPSGCQFPYEELLRENAGRSVREDEFEIFDTEAFRRGFWEIRVEYARLTAEGAADDDKEEGGSGGDTVCLLTARNCGDTERALHVLPTVWFRNTWNTAYAVSEQDKQPAISRLAGDPGTVECRHPSLPDLFVHFNADSGGGAESSQQVLFTRNETGEKDAISRYLVGKFDEPRPSLPASSGTKCCSVHLLTAGPGESRRVAVRLSSRHRRPPQPPPSDGVVASGVARQRAAAEAFYAGVLDWLPSGEAEVAEICRTAYSGLLWSKQYYEYRVAEFQRRRQPGAFKWNPHGWEHLDNADIMSMPDKWEFPWYASWDSSFHAAVLVDVDPEFAKGQIELLLSDRFMSPEGQVPGCEFNYSDENPPVLAWAAHEIWLATGDAEFARRVYPRLKLNFAWWLRHRRVQPESAGEEDKDAVYFKSGFLGMDNICAFDRSQVPDGCRVYQADAYAWVFATALHCLQLALATDQSADEVAFWLDWLARLQRGFRHLDADGDGFCYDILEQRVGGSGGDDAGPGVRWVRQFVRIKSMVGLMPLTAALAFDRRQLVGGAHAEAVQRAGLRVEQQRGGGSGGDKRLALVSLLTGDQWMRVFGHLCPPAHAGAGGKGVGHARQSGDEDEAFLGPYGVRMVSRWHRRHPVTLRLAGADWTLDYEPGESRTRMYGGNSNWRGPVWLCMNFLLAQAALRVHAAGRPRPELRRFARLVCERVLGIFTASASDGRRPVHGDCPLFAAGGPWSGPEFALFYEYFHGDTGRGCGASHQTGWTAMVVKFAEMLHTRLTAG